MAPLRWPGIHHDLALAKEVAQRNPGKTQDWEEIAQNLSTAFSSDEIVVQLKARGCRERMERLLSRCKQEDAKALKRSGTEEEYTELHQLCEDISTYRRDMTELRNQQKEAKKSKDEEDRKKAEEMRKAAVEGLAKRRSETSIESSEESTSSEGCSETDKVTPSKGRKKKVKTRASKKSAVDMLATKYAEKPKIKKYELDLKKQELEFTKEKYEAEAEERKARMELEMEERKTILSLLKDRL